jgi:hypothetical protein
MFSIREAAKGGTVRVNGTRGLKTGCAALLCLALSCTFSPADQTPLLMTRADTLGDTVWLFPALAFALSSPVADEHNAAMAITPDPGDVYYSYLSESRETVFVSITGMLEARTAYAIRPAYAIEPASGAALTPDQASFAFYTGPGEREPNNTLASADRAAPGMCGRVSTANDTDWFVTDCADSRAVWLVSYDQEKCALRITDSTGATVTAPYSRGRIDTLAAPDSFHRPLAIAVYSATGVAGLRYSLGTITSTGNGE